jgi:hypothetical protein
MCACGTGKMIAENFLAIVPKIQGTQEENPAYGHTSQREVLWGCPCDLQMTTNYFQSMWIDV